MTNTKAEKGDLIRIVKAFEGERYRDGEILEVVAANQKWSGVDAKLTIAGNSITVHVLHTEYVIHRKAGEEDSPYKPLIDFAQAEIDRFEAEQAQDAVNSPNHYTQGKFETIEIIEHLTSKYDDGFTAHCVGTAFKYMDRAPYKHESPTECLRKAAKYLSFAIERLDAKSTQD